MVVGDEVVLLDEDVPFSIMEPVDDVVILVCDVGVDVGINDVDPPVDDVGVIVDVDVVDVGAVLVGCGDCVVVGSTL